MVSLSQFMATYGNKVLLLRSSMMYMFKVLLLRSSMMYNGSGYGYACGS